MTASKFIVKTASARMPQSCKGIYRRVAVLAIEPELDDVAMISERARGCLEIVAEWDRLSASGTTLRSEYRRALIEAEAMAAALNADASRESAQAVAERTLELVIDGRDPDAALAASLARVGVTL
jgi:hypothetical protein